MLAVPKGRVTNRLAPLGAAAAAGETKDQLFERRELRLEAMEMANRVRAETEAHEPLRAALPAPQDDQERVRVATASRDLRQVAERRDEPRHPRCHPTPAGQHRLPALEGDFLSQGTQLLAQLSIELEAEQHIGASRYPGRTRGRCECSPERKTYRNGYRDRLWETRVGEVPLRIPKLREGNCFPSLLEPRRRAGRALLAVVQAACVQGVSTRKVDDLVQALGLTGVDKSRVSRSCQELDEAVERFRNRPLQGAYP